MFRFATPLLITAGALNDETSLMQGMKPNQVAGKVDKSKAVSSLLATATSMLKNGETADVVEFASATLTEIRTEVLDAIQRAHNEEQLLINRTHELFELALHNLEQDNNLVTERHDRERQYSRLHKNCRTEEAAICRSKQECDYDLYEIWERFVEEEYELRDLSKQVEDHFCVEGANGTMWAFRDHSITLFPPWRTQKPIVEHWEQQYHVKVPVCEEWYRLLDEKTEECNGYQERLEQYACEHYSEVLETRIHFASYWSYAVDAYQTLVDEVHCNELDRWKEWRTLETVQCLLERTTLRNGRPCDETTDEATVEYTQCEQLQQDVDIDHIRIRYPQPPPEPAPCATPPWEGDVRPAVEYWPGRCVPVLPTMPCDAAYQQQEYSGLPVVPEALFHHENSHCNPRQACSACQPMIEPPWCRCFYLWFTGITGVQYTPNEAEELLECGANLEFLSPEDAYWVDIPLPEHECMGVTGLQREAGFYPWVHLGYGNGAVTAAPLNPYPNSNLD